MKVVQIVLYGSFLVFFVSTVLNLISNMRKIPVPPIILICPVCGLSCATVNAYMHSIVNFAVCPFWRSVVLWKCQQLYHVESILSAFDILQHILYATSFSGKKEKKAQLHETGCTEITFIYSLLCCSL